MIQFAVPLLFVFGLMTVGAWLERIGGMSDAMDKFLTPLPLGIGGLCIVFLEWAVP